MSAFPCSIHGHKVNGRLASLYSAWFTANGERSAWKQRICAPCAKQELARVLEHAAEENSAVTVCPACGSDSATDLDPIYLTLYVPKQEPKEFALTTCSTCAVTLRLRLQVGAEKLPNRDGFTSRNNSSDDDTDWGVPA
jgi:hypothetical protein